MTDTTPRRYEDGVWARPIDQDKDVRQEDEVQWCEITLEKYRELKDAACRIMRLQDFGPRWRYFLGVQPQQWIPFPPAPGGRQPTEDDTDENGFIACRWKLAPGVCKLASLPNSDFPPRYWLPLPKLAERRRSGAAVSRAQQKEKL